MSVEKSKQGSNKFNLFDKTSRMAAYTLQATVSGGTPTYTWVNPNAESEANA